jgi:hypothetical protein
MAVYIFIATSGEGLIAGIELGLLGPFGAAGKSIPAWCGRHPPKSIESPEFPILSMTSLQEDTVPRKRWEA